jgi:hypothetical protein
VFATVLISQDLKKFVSIMASFWFIFYITTNKEAKSVRRLFLTRAVLIVISLLCLCLSDSVRPRLLPLPNAAVSVSGLLNFVDGPQALSAPSKEKETTPHLAIASTSQYRAGERHQHSHQVVQGPGFSLQYLPVRSNSHCTDALVKTSAGSVSIPSGRAPPRRV